ADTLMRSGLNFAAIEMEVVMGVSPRGSYCRDLMETSRLLDFYSLLGTPLWVTMGYPSAAGSDPLAAKDMKADAGCWHNGFSPDVQAEWAEAFFSLALCKPTV